MSATVFRRRWTSPPAVRMCWSSGPVADVEVRSIPEGSVEFVRALAGEMSVVAAMQVAMMADCRFDLSANLAGLMQAGALVGHSFAQAKKSRKSARRS